MPFELEKTVTGKAYLTYRMTTNVLSQPNLSGQMLYSGLAITPVVEFFNPPILEKYMPALLEFTFYATIGAAIYNNPKKAIPSITMNLLGQKILDDIWSSLPDRYKSNEWFNELYALLYIGKYEASDRLANAAADKITNWLSPPAQLQITSESSLIQKLTKYYEEGCRLYKMGDTHTQGAHSSLQGALSHLNNGGTIESQNRRTWPTIKEWFTLPTAQPTPIAQPVPTNTSPVYLGKYNFNQPPKMQAQRRAEIARRLDEISIRLDEASRFASEMSRQLEEGERHIEELSQRLDELGRAERSLPILVQEPVAIANHRNSLFSANRNAVNSPPPRRANGQTLGDNLDIAFSVYENGGDAKEQILHQNVNRPKL